MTSTVVSFPCSRCEKTFSSRSNAGAHVRRVHEQKATHECSTCKKMFYDKSQLRVHVKNVHEKSKDFKCPHDNCNETFGYSNVLSKHILRKHTTIRAFPCPVTDCGIKFATLSDLQSHSTTHTQERNHKCTWVDCDDTFPHRSTLVEHLKNHANPSDKLFKCSECSYQSNRRAKVVEHGKQVHEKIKPFKCDKCEMSFPRPAHLRIHNEAVHLRLRPLACTVVGCDYVSAYEQQIAHHREFGHREDGTRVRNGVEHRVLTMVEQHYVDLERGFKIDCRPLGIARQRVEVDAAIRFPTKELLVLLEVDEDQHKDPTKYTPEDEVARMSDANEVLMENDAFAHVLWVRFNTSAFMVNGEAREVHLSERVHTLYRFLEAYEATGETPGVVYLFYDRVTSGEGEDVHIKFA